jgi:hypothetical protein
MEEQAAPERTESPKQRKVKTGVNLRKSLAIVPSLPAKVCFILVNVLMFLSYIQ